MHSRGSEALPSTLRPDANLQGVPVEEVGAAPPARRPPGAGALVPHGGEGGPDALALAASAAAAAVVAHVDGVGAELVLPARAGGTAAEEVTKTETKRTEIFRIDTKPSVALRWRSLESKICLRRG